MNTPRPHHPPRDNIRPLAVMREELNDTANHLDAICALLWRCGSEQIDASYLSVLLTPLNRTLMQVSSDLNDMRL